MSVEIMAHVWRCGLKSDEKFVALALADHANPDGGDVFPSQATIARMVGKSIRAVRGTIRKLEARGVLVREPWPANTHRYHPTRRYRIELGALPPPEDPSDLPPEKVSGTEGDRSEGSSGGRPERFSGATGSPLPGQPETRFRRSVRDPEEEEDHKNSDQISSSSSDLGSAETIERGPICPEHGVEGIASERTLGTYWHVAPGAGSGTHTFTIEAKTAPDPVDPYARNYLSEWGDQ